MCDPVSIALELAAAAGKAYFDNKAQNDIQNKRNAVVANTTADLHKIQQPALEAYNKSVDANSRPTMDAAEAKAQADRTNQYQGAISTGDLLPGQGNASDSAKTAIVNSLASGTAQAKDAAGKRAAFDAYGDAEQGREIATNRGAEAINQQGDFANGRAQVGQIQLANPQVNYSKYTGYGDLINAAGSLGAMGYSSYNDPSRLANRTSSLKSAISSSSAQNGMPLTWS